MSTGYSLMLAVLLTLMAQSLVQCQEENNVKKDDSSSNDEVVAIPDEAPPQLLNDSFWPMFTRSSGLSVEKARSQNSNIDFSQFPGALCNRVCQSHDRRVCYFKFALEHYQAMGVACRRCAEGVESDCNHPQCVLGDGYEKGVMSINRQIPGPAIQVCRGDLIVVDVVNMAGGTAAAIHWHGLHMRDTPWMDGVPYVTQCPIPFATTFRYEFWATEAGTQFYHSHAGHHKINGQYGALIIRKPIAEDPHVVNYDYDLPEHHIILSDWMHRYAEDLFPGLPGMTGIHPDSVLINGRGSFINPDSGKRSSVPPTRFYVTAGKRYRFRLINSISHACPVQIQIERHRFSIIASDSYDVEPYFVDTLVSNSGERYDFVLETNQPPGDYWIRLRGLGVCSLGDSMALLRYNSSRKGNEATRAPPAMPSYSDEFPVGVMLNHPNASCFGGYNDHCVTELSALEPDNNLRFAKPDYQFYLGFNNYRMDNAAVFYPGRYEHFMNVNTNVTMVGAINNLSLTFPDFPPLTQPENIKEGTFCDQFNRPKHCLGRRFCPCVHRLRVKTGSVVELFVIDENQMPGRLHHPFHLHGFPFMVTGLAQHPLGIRMSVQLARQMERTRGLPRDYFNGSPPWKDTVTIPSYGYAVFRFRANNPGYWLMHCHYEWHLAVGMGLIVQVGENDEMVPPPNGFPKCGNFLPGMLPLPQH